MKGGFEYRFQLILNAIVGSYIDTAEPVGSRTLSKTLGLELSPATIRNVMADLTDQGYLDQPHTSAGRVPTDKAYRYYVDSVVTLGKLPPSVKRMIDEVVGDSGGSLERMLVETTKMLATLTEFTGVVAAPRINTTRLKVIEFIKVSSNRIYVVLITKSNMVYNKIVEIGEDLTQEFLNSVSSYLNDQFSEQSLSEIRHRMMESLIEDKEQYDQMLAQAVRLSKKAFDFGSERELYVEGQFNILHQVDNLDDIQRLLKALEEKITILDLLDQTLSATGVSIAIGIENEVEDLRGFSVITANYGNGANMLGSLGVIGPTRMDYFRVVPIIDYTARTLSRSIANQ